MTQRPDSGVAVGVGLSDKCRTESHEGCRYVLYEADRFGLGIGVVAGICECPCHAEEEETR